jgi:hypothetical protein
MAYSKLERSNDVFANMMTSFGVVTVMNANVYAIDGTYKFEDHTAEQICTYYLGKDKTDGLLAHIDTLKVANVTVEGPNKTVSGGQYSNPLIKFGKSARLEMQDALGRADAIEAFGGAVNEYSALGGQMTGMHITEDFAPTRLIIGESFFISKETGQQVKVNIVFYQVLPDSIFNLTQDAEGDATVFDMNADLLTTNILVGHKDNNDYTHGVFYSILPQTKAIEYYTISKDGKITIATDYSAKLDSVAVVSGETTIPEEGYAAKLVIFDKEDKEVASYVLVG